MKRKVSAFIGCVLAALAVASSPTRAQTYPEKPIRLIVPFAPGGGSDIIARALSNQLGPRLRQQVLVDNKPGAGGIIGTDLVAKAAPDGYTILMPVGSHAINPHVVRSLPFDPIKDFEAVTMIASAPMVLAVHGSVSAKTVKELVELAKSQPGKLTYASSGNGTVFQLTGEQFKLRNGINLVHVPYKGGGPAIQALLSGEVTMIFSTLTTILPHLKSDRIRPIAIAASKRAAQIPDVPTMAEEGLEGFEERDWYGIMTPARTPKEIIAKLQSSIASVVNDPEFTKFLLQSGFVPVGNTASQFASDVTTDFEKAGKIVKAAGIKVD